MYIGEFDHMSVGYSDVKTEADLKAIKDAMKPYKLAPNDLVNQCKACVSNFNKAMAASTKQKNSQAGGKQKTTGSNRLAFWACAMPPTPLECM